MARNAEKAMTTLARWRAAHEHTDQVKDRRPYLASECKSLPAAEKWRSQIIREISRKVAQIQNAGLGEFRIRDLNDEINKLLREKSHWEAQIKELDGPDYARVGPRMLDHDGKEVPGNRGYKYFGAAKDLPVIQQKIAEWKAKKLNLDSTNNIEAEEPDEPDIYAVEGEAESEEEGEDPSKSSKQRDDEDDEVLSSQPRFIAHVSVPSQKEVEQALLERKKQQLLEKYASPAIKQEQEKAKQFLEETDS
ncbi:pre-mRNA-splicing factor ISY1 homolog [Diaphorina citri]|uniref:Pre-mRNA-splicing factor ISY1 homolog n=1 Tax=Diaphorina citri TaxID=121845 RepID=A0A3Q0JPF4_DIACI|nr:pre-mRNA-splicing factor ISY1 homolog [Diaphorina citri]